MRFLLRYLFTGLLFTGLLFIIVSFKAEAAEGSPLQNRGTYNSIMDVVGDTCEKRFNEVLKKGLIGHRQYLTFMSSCTAQSTYQIYKTMRQRELSEIEM